MIADIILHDVPYLSRYELAEKYGLYSFLKEVDNDVLFYMWNTGWEDGMKMYLSIHKWVSLTGICSTFRVFLKVGVSYISLTTDAYTLAVFENTEYNLRLLGGVWQNDSI